jgi:hypothetical protein
MNPERLFISLTVSLVSSHAINTEYKILLNNPLKFTNKLEYIICPGKPTSPRNSIEISTIHSSAGRTGHEKARTSRIVGCLAYARQQEREISSSLITKMTRIN